MMKLNLMKYSKHLDITLFGIQQRASLLGIQGSKEVILLLAYGCRIIISRSHLPPRRTREMERISFVSFCNWHYGIVYNNLCINRNHYSSVFKSLVL